MKVNKKSIEVEQLFSLELNCINSLVVCRKSPGRIIGPLFWPKYEVPRGIKPRILKLTIRRGQSTICIVFICVCWAENDYYCFVSAGQLSFDSRKYCGSSCRMQGWSVANLPSAELLNILSRSRLFSVPRRRQKFSLLPTSRRHFSLK